MVAESDEVLIALRRKALQVTAGDQRVVVPHRQAVAVWRADAGVHHGIPQPAHASCICFGMLACLMVLAQTVAVAVWVAAAAHCACLHAGCTCLAALACLVVLAHTVADAIWVAVAAAAAAGPIWVQAGCTPSEQLSRLVRLAHAHEAVPAVQHFCSTRALHVAACLQLLPP